MEWGNSTSIPEESAQANTLFLGVMYLVAGVLVMLSNGVVLFVVYRTKALQQPTLWVISHMAFWDFVMGIFNLTILLPSALMNRFAYSERYMGLVASLITYLVSLLFFNVATIVIDRSISLRYPLAYAKMRKSKYVFGAIVVHILAVCRMLLVSFPDMDFYYNMVAAAPLSDYGNVRETLLSLSFLAASLIIIIVCSSLIIHTVKQRRRCIGQGGVNVISSNIIKLSVMSVLSAGVFCLSFVPLATTIFWNLSVGYDKIPHWVVQVMILCILSNSVWNVLIYAATYQPFRQSLIFIFCRSYYRKMLRKRHGIKSSEKVDAKSNTVSDSNRMLILSADSLVVKPFSSGLQVPNHLFLASSVKRIP